MGEEDQTIMKSLSMGVEDQTIMKSPIMEADDPHTMKVYLAFLVKSSLGIQ